MPWLDLAGEAEGEAEVNGCLEGACALAEEEAALWRPLVLLIPLRLGLSDINEAYIETLKVRKLHSRTSNPTFDCRSLLTIKREENKLYDQMDSLTIF